MGGTRRDSNSPPAWVGRSWDWNDVTGMRLGDARKVAVVVFDARKAAVVVSISSSPEALSPLSQQTGHSINCHSVSKLGLPQEESVERQRTERRKTGSRPATGLPQCQQAGRFPRDGSRVIRSIFIHIVMIVCPATFSPSIPSNLLIPSFCRVVKAFSCPGIW